MKTTKWYPNITPPAHEGLYETLVGGMKTWSVWKDGVWHFASSNVEKAIAEAEVGSISFWQKREWRGLTEKAN